MTKEVSVKFCPKLMQENRFVIEPSISLRGEPVFFKTKQIAIDFAKSKGCIVKEGLFE